MAQMSMRERLTMEKVQCPECRVVFEKAREKRMAIMSCGESKSSFGDEGVAVWVYVQTEK